MSRTPAFQLKPDQGLPDLPCCLWQFYLLLWPHVPLSPASPSSLPSYKCALFFPVPTPSSQNCSLCLDVLPVPASLTYPTNWDPPCKDSSRISLFWLHVLTVSPYLSRHSEILLLSVHGRSPPSPRYTTGTSGNSLVSPFRISQYLALCALEHTPCSTVGRPVHKACQ